MRVTEVLQKQFNQVEHEINHEEKYTWLVNFLGYNKVKACLPYTVEEIKKALQSDEHLNNLPMHKWDLASGFICSGTNCKPVPSQLRSVLLNNGINCYSNSQGVCILKQCARMLASEV